MNIFICRIFFYYYVHSFFLSVTIGNIPPQMMVDQDGSGSKKSTIQRTLFFVQIQL